MSILFEQELQKAGLRDKQAAIYLALLALGPSSVQKIARKAKVARPTTYLVLDWLIQRGLVTENKLGKRPIFIAASPDHLLRLVQREEQVLAERKDDLERLLPQLMALFQAGNKGLSVRYYSGIAGLQQMRHEMAMQCTPEDTWYNLAPSDELLTVFGPKDFYCRARVAKGIQAQTIFTTQSTDIKNKLLKSSREHRTIRRFIEPTKFPITAGLTIFGNRVAIGSFTDNPSGIIVESSPVAEMLRHVFNVMWEKLEA